MNLKRHHVLYVLLAVCLIIALLVFMTPHSAGVSFRNTGVPKSTQLLASSTSDITFEFATSSLAQEKGLGGRAVIPQNYGMLFVFPADKKPGFWMKDMLAPIDIIWLSDTGTIIGVEDSLSPNTYPAIFYPPQPVKYVLETKAGEMRRKGWNVGTTIELPLPYGN